jgi:hypothetical protein
MPNEGRQTHTRPGLQASSLIANPAADLLTDLIAELADLGRALRGLFDPYRPERHYMRGPGPKWHAKHAPPLLQVTAAHAPKLTQIA